MIEYGLTFHNMCSSFRKRKANDIAMLLGGVSAIFPSDIGHTHQ
jgi:hypothetical protein